MICITLINNVISAGEASSKEPEGEKKVVTEETDVNRTNDDTEIDNWLQETAVTVEEPLLENAADKTAPNSYSKRLFKMER